MLHWLELTFDGHADPARTLCPHFDIADHLHTQ